jgi:transcriptional regulator with XRE-family HTH domain
MTPERLRECLAALNWSTAALAAMAQISPVTARRWLNGQREIPSKVAAAMETMLAQQRHFAPVGRKRRNQPLTRMDAQ